MNCKNCKCVIRNIDPKIKITRICNVCQIKLNQNFEKKFENGKYTVKKKQLRDKLSNSINPKDWIAVRDWDLLEQKNENKEVIKLTKKTNDVFDKPSFQNKPKNKVKSQKDPGSHKDFFKDVDCTESKNYFNDRMNSLDRQIKNLAEQSPRLTTIERLRATQNFNLKPSDRSKTAKLITLKLKYPYFPRPFNEYHDRDKIQYGRLVSTKNLKVAEFVLKWEHDHKRRINKNMAWEILTELLKINVISDEFLKRINQKYAE